MQKAKFNKKLIEWYSFQKRDLPWRNTKDPYKIWISEIILQQTRIVQGLPYYRKFLEKYPKLSDLANASETEILRMWQGLGYYSRARNMLFCAKTLQSDYSGHFPETFEELSKLKGIGGYTAAAIVSFAFGKAVAVVDGNVFRVLARIFGVEEDITSTVGKKKFKELAQKLISEEDPGNYNQAIMEFGALQCVPKNPICTACVFQEDCFAFINDSVQSLPVKNKKPKNRKRFFHYFVIKKDGKLLMKIREKGDIWTGLYDFHMHETDEPKDFREVADIIFKGDVNNIRILHSSNMYKHVLTHQTIFAMFYEVELCGGEIENNLKNKNLIAYSLKEIDILPKPNLISHFLNDRFLLAL